MRLTWEDAYIERWAAVYLDPLHNRILRARGVRFETFLLAPAELLAAARRPTAGLLPAQRAVQMRLDQARALAELVEAAGRQFFGASYCANGRLVARIHRPDRQRRLRHYPAVSE